MSTTLRSFLSLVVLTLVGCGGADLPELATVSGKVTMNGEPVPGIFVMAVPTEGRPSYGTVGEDGTYKLEYKKDLPGTVVGPTKISLTWPQGGGGPAIPGEYANMDYDVTPGANNYDIEMTSEAKEWKDFDPSKAAGPAD